MGALYPGDGRVTAHPPELAERVAQGPGRTNHEEAVVIIRAGAAAFPINLDRMSPIPLYHQLFGQFTAAIVRGDLKPGDTLEREDLLAERLGVARHTLRKALINLATRGLVSRSRGHGTVITMPPGSVPHASTDVVVGPFREDALAIARLLRLEPDRKDPQAALELGLDEHTTFVYLEHLCVTSGRGVSLRRAWVPASLVNPVLHDLSTVPIGKILGELGHAAVTDRRTFARRPPDSSELRLLTLTLADHVFTVCAVAFDHLGTPVQRTAVTYAERLARESNELITPASALG